MNSVCMTFYCLIMTTLQPNSPTVLEHCTEPSAASPPPPSPSYQAPPSIVAFDRLIAEFEPTQFEHTMSLIALIRVKRSIQTNGTLIALINSSIHGVTSSALVTPFGPFEGVSLFHAMIYGSTASNNQKIEFMFKDFKKVVWNLNTSLVFGANGAFGNAMDPIHLT